MYFAQYSYQATSAFTYNHHEDNGQQLESCPNDYHQASERILVKLWIEPATSCSQVLYTTGLATKALRMIFIYLSTLFQMTNFRLFQSSKLKEFADDSFKFDENDKFHQMGRKHCGKRRNCLLHSVYRRHVLQTGKNKDLFGRG